MSDTAPDDDRPESLVDLLTTQIVEQLQALQDVIAAMAEDPSAELQDMHRELLVSITEAEEALRDVTASMQQPDTTSKEAKAALDDRIHSSEGASTSHATLIAGGPCRFQYLDGQVHVGTLREVHNDHARVSFNIPTKHHMLHAVYVPLPLVLPASSDTSIAPAVGRRVLARPQGCRLWEVGVCTAVSPQFITVTWQKRGTSQDVRPADVVASAASSDESDSGSGAEDADASVGGRGRRRSQTELADLSRGDGEDTSSGSSDGDDGNEDAEEDMDEDEVAGFGALGHARLALAAGIQTDTLHFAEWETHSRGIASKLLAGMGYVRGTGLGRAGKGIVAPLEVQLLQQRRGLGDGASNATKGGGGGGSRKRRKRGGERSRLKRHKAAQQAAKQRKREGAAKREAEHGAPGLFAFINQSLGDSSEAAAKMRAAEAAAQGLASASNGQQGTNKGTAGGAAGAGGASSLHAADGSRRGLLAQHDVAGAAQGKVQQLRAMLERNKGNKGLAPQIEAKLREAEAELAAARSQTARANKAVMDVEAQKKWMRF